MRSEGPPRITDDRPKWRYQRGVSGHCKRFHECGFSVSKKPPLPSPLRVVRRSPSVLACLFFRLLKIDAAKLCSSDALARTREMVSQSDEIACPQAHPHLYARHSIASNCSRFSHISSRDFSEATFVTTTVSWYAIVINGPPSKLLQERYGSPSHLVYCIHNVDFDS